MSTHRVWKSGGWALAAIGLALVAGGLPASANAPAEVGAAAGSASAAGEASAAHPPAKALRYLKVLRKNPKPGYLFDRFCDAWLASASQSSLETYLRQRAANGKGADQLLLAYYLAREGRNPEAIKVFGRTLSRHPGNATAWYQKARVEAATLDFDAALEDLGKARGAAPAPKLAANIAKLRGRLLARVGKPARARAVWAALLKQHPEDAALREDVVRLEVDEGQYDQAIKTLQALIAHTRDAHKRVTRRLWVGDIQQRAGRRDAALDTYQATLLEVGRGTWLEREVLAQIEHVYRRQKDLEGLAKRYDQLIKAHPRRIALRKRRARLLAQRGRTKAALKAWRAVLQRTPGDQANRRAYARLLADADQPGRAVQQIQRLLKDHPDDSSLRRTLAQLEHRAGDDKAAAAAVRAMLQRSDHTTGSYLRAARLLERLELKGPAAKVMDQMVAAKPDDTGRQEAMAEFRYRRGDKVAAIKIWRSLAAKAPSAQALTQVARSLASRGESKQAYDVLERRADQFADDPAFLEAICTAATRAGEDKAALPHALAWVRKAKGPAALGRAIEQAAAIARRADRENALIHRLKGDKDRRVAETCLLVELLEQVGDSPAADAALAAAPADDPRVMAQRVRLYRRREQWGKAAAAMERMVALPGGPKVKRIGELIGLYVRDGRIDKALGWVKRWKALSPGSVSPWLKQARLLAEDGKNDRAIEVLQTAWRRFDDEPAVASVLARRYARAGRRRDATGVYWQLYEKADSTQGKIQWVTRIAQLNQSGGGMKRVVKRLEAQRDHDRQSIEPDLALAAVYKVHGQYEKRRQALTEAAAIQPDNLDLLLTIARAEQQSGDVERAVKTLRRARSLDDSGRVRQRLADLLLYNGENDRALALINDPDSHMDQAAVLSLVGRLGSQGDWRSAAGVLRPRVAAAPRDYRLRYALAVALEEDQRTQPAIHAFLRVLGADHELAPGGKSAGSASGPAWYWTQRYNAYYGDMLPPRARTLMTDLRGSSLAYRYRHRRPGMGMMGMVGGGGQPGLAPPYALAQVHAMATAHLRNLAQWLDPAQQKKLVARMKDRGVPFASLLMDMPQIARGGRLPPRVIRTHGDDPAVLALGVMMYANSRGTGLDPDLLDKAMKRFSKDRPALALLAALSRFSHAAEDDKARAAAWLRARSLLKRIDQPPPMLLMSVAQFANATAAGAGSPLSEAQRGVIVQRMLAWYPKLDTAQRGIKQWAFRAILGSLATSHDWDKFTKLLVDQARRDREAAAKGSSLGGRAALARYVNPQGRLFQPLPFPPTPLKTLSPQLVSLFNANRHLGGGGPVDFDAILGHLGPDADPLLRLLAAGAAGKDKAADKAAKRLLAQKPPSLDGYLAAASWAGKQGRPAQAAKVLDEARSLPMGKGWRQRVDGAILAFALKADDPAAVKKPAQRAALRLRRAAVSASQRQQLVSAMRRLGMKGPAQKLEQRMVAAASGRPAGGFVPFSQGRFVQMGGGQRAGASLSDRVTGLIEKDRREAAARLVFQAVRLRARGMLSSGRWSGGRYQNRSLPALMKTHKLEAAVMKLADPGHGAARGRLVRYAAQLEVLGKPKAARAIYERVAAGHAPPMAGLIRLTVLQVSDGDAKAAARTLGKLRPMYAQRAGSMIVNAVNSRVSHQADAPVVLARAAATWLKGLDHPRRWQLGWVDSVFPQLIAARSTDKVRLAMMYAADRDHFKVDEDKKQASEALARRRERAHDELAKAMLGVPSLARQGFRRLLMTRTIRGDDLAPMVPLAKKVILARPRPGAAPGMGYLRVVYGGNRPRRARMRGPEELLADQAPDQVAAVVDQLQKHRQREARLLQAVASLYTADSAHYADTAGKYLDTVRRGAGGFARSANAPLALVVAVWKRRGLTGVDLQPLLLKRIKQNPASSQLATPALAYARALADRGDHAAVRGLFDALARAYLGPADKRVALLRRVYQPNHWSSPSPSANAHAFLQVLRQALYQPKLIWPAIHQTRPFRASGVAGGAKGFDQQLNQAMRRMAQRAVKDKSIDRFTRLLTGSPLLADAKGFRSFPFSDTGNTSAPASLLRALAAGFRYRGSKGKEMKKRLTQWVQGRDPQTLGATLLLAALHKDDPAKTIRAIAPHLAAIRAMSKDRQRQILAALPPFTTSPSGLGGDAAALGDLLAKLNSRSQLARAAKILAKKRLDPQNNEQYEIGSRLRSIVPALVDSGHADKAAKLLEHWAKLCERYARLNRRSVNTRIDDALNQMLDVGADHALARFAFVIHAIQDPGIAGGLRSAEPSNLRWRLRELVEKADPAKGEGPKRARQLRAVIGQFAKALGDADAAPLIGPLARVDRDLLGDDQHKAMVAWVVEQKNKHPGSAFWPDIESAARMARLSDVPKKRNPQYDADLAFVERRLAKVLGDDALPVTLRLVMAGKVLQNSQLKLPKAAGAAAKVLLPTLAQGPSSPSSTSAWSGAITPLLDKVMKYPQLPDWIDPSKLVTAYADAIGRPQRNGRRRALSLRVPGYLRMQNSPSRTRPTTATRMLALAASHGDDHAVDRMLAAQKGKLGQSPAAWWVLASHGRPERAAKLISRHWADAKPTLVSGPASGRPGDADKAGDQSKAEDAGKAIAAVADQLDDADLKLYAVAALRAAAGAGRPGDPHHAGRGNTVQEATTTPPIHGKSADDGEAEADKAGDASDADDPASPAALAGRFAKMSFRNDILRRRTLLMLAADPDMLPRLAGPLAHAARNLPVNLLLTRNHSNQYFQRQLVYASIRSSLLANDPGPLVAAAKALTPDKKPQQNNWQYRNALRSLTQMFRQDVIEHRLDRIPLDKLAAMGAFTRRVLAAPDWMNHISISSELYTLNILLCDLDPKTGNAQAWMDSLTKKQQKWDHRLAGNTDGVIQLRMIAKALVGTDKHPRYMPDAKRVAVVGQLLTDPAAVASFRHDRYNRGEHKILFQRCVVENLVTPKEVAAHGIAWAKAQPRDGLAWLELKLIAQQVGDDKVEKTADAALKKQPVDDSVRRAMAQRLRRVGQAEAAKLLVKAKQAEAGRPLTGAWARLRDRLQIDPLPKPKPKAKSGSGPEASGDARSGAGGKPDPKHAAKRGADPASRERSVTVTVTVEAAAAPEAQSP